MAHGYFYTHGDLASTTGLGEQRVGKLAAKLSGVLDAYRIRGDKNKCLYDSSGLKVWEEIARMDKQGLGPKNIEENLRKLFGNQEYKKDPLRPWMEGGKEPAQRKVGDEVVPRFVYENTRADLKQEISDQKEQIKKKDSQISDLQDQLRMLPAPDDWKRNIQEANRARERTVELLKELKDIEDKIYGWFRMGERVKDKARVIDILEELDMLNFNHL